MMSEETFMQCIKDSQAAKTSVEDLKTNIATIVELACKKAIEDHYDRVSRPHIKEVSYEVDTIDKRVGKLESDKKGIIWVTVAITSIFSVIFSVIKPYFIGK